MDELKKLYSDSSKHSVYQNIPDFVAKEIDYKEEIDSGWRDDRIRLEYLLKHVQPKSGESWGDFGANTGFFTLTLANENRDTNFVAIEANDNHAQFIQTIKSAFDLNNVSVMGAVALDELDTIPKTDFMLHLNVLHHAGHDFDADKLTSIDGFPEYAVAYLNKLGLRVNRMLFQIGSNWGGDKSLPLVPVPDDFDKLKLFADILIESGWKFDAVSFPTKVDGNVMYVDIPDMVLNALNENRIGDVESDLNSYFQTVRLEQFPGEFYRRALFICSH